MLENLNRFFHKNPKIALAFSGGVDSSFLFYAAKNAGAEVRAYYVKTPFQPEFELEDAKALAQLVGGDLSILSFDITENQDVTANTPERCYYCKRKIFEKIKKQAEKDGFSVLIDGTNASDDADDRPGMKALQELEVRSPLRECGMNKEMIRSLSGQAGLFTWNKAAYACLATRIQTGEPITKEKLNVTEKAENYLFLLGFRDFRVRLSNGMAKLQVREEDLPKVLEMRKEIQQELRKYYKDTVLDLVCRE